MLKTFVGYKGKMAAAQINGVSFVILAKTDRQLDALWSHIMPGTVLDPRGIKSAILIESKLLPEKTNKSEPNPDETNRSQTDEAN